jgi:glutathione S-transferase
MIKLYDFLPCPFGQKVRIVLAEKGLTYDLAQVDISKGENRHQDFFRLNPFGKVPVLVDDDATIYDSTIINEYLEDEYPEPPLLSSVTASALRARARRAGPSAGRFRGFLVHTPSWPTDGGAGEA